MSSPCIGICRIDDFSGMCEGCGRTMEEISGWPSASEAEQQQTLATVAERMAENNFKPVSSNTDTDNK
ncbi:MAG: DUF1289 domain-containing protein [Rhodocyclaceae bacterium]|nr:DUF1289 domain-containing protein [Rhodocyclaceae bacterium]MBP7081415.1 DUF1289 domain-containing protein [Rhodocyclaceae bacterium]